MWVRAYAVKGQQGIMGRHLIFCTRNERFVNNICVYGTFAKKIGATALNDVVALSTKLFARARVVRVHADAVSMIRIHCIYIFHRNKVRLVNM